ncbi:MAG TPA: LysM peptidoglycan-binding domain-containing protein [Candidatus Saccharimonadales bacterium]|nr:LysM peptidoglycan-binding domain-containing protein [Candidatus Saccharimonadales bacterium]
MRRRVVRYGLMAGNLAILGVIVLFVLQNSSATGSNKSNPVSDAPVTASVVNPLDQLSSAQIALTVARMSNLPESIAVNNQADSQATELATAATQDNVIAKPQVIATALKSRANIQNYTTVAGDTLSGLAVKFGVTSESIRWSNGLPSTDALKAGVKLIIPPVNGLVYTVKAGDTAASLASRYNVSQDQIIAYNDAYDQTGGLQVGEQIIIPDATQPAPVVSAITASWGSATYGPYNGYDYGYCTWWVAQQRANAGNPLPSNLGNASTWGIRARAYGLPTGTTPAVGAAVVTSTRGEGHVAYVTGVNADGSITVTEMNVSGWNRVDTATYSGTFTYIY